MDEIKEDITSLCFMNVQWFARLRDVIDADGNMDEGTWDFIEHCQAENKALFEKYSH